MGSLKITTIVVLILCLIWMDACLYFQIQSFEDGESTINESTRLSGHGTTLNNGTGDPQNAHYSLPTSPTIETNATNDMRHHRTLPFMKKFSFAFQGMSVKLMMTDPVDNYLLAPLSEAFADMVNFNVNFPFITANMVSYAGVVSALIAAKLVTYDSSTMHILSYVMFQLRTWLDDLDGAVARSRLGIHKHVSLQKTSGYVVDGICDAIGFVAYIIGCYIYLKNTISRNRHIRRRTGNRYNLQSITEVKSSNSQSHDYVPLEQKEQHRPSIGQQNNSNYSDEDYYNSYEEEEEYDDDDGDEEILHNTLDQVVHHNHSNNHLQLHGSSNTMSKKEERTSFLVTKRLLSRSRVFINKIQTNGKHSHMIFYRYIKEKIKDNLSNRRLVLLTVCFLLQLAMCATFWNRYILVYQELLETNTPSSLNHHVISQEQQRVKHAILKSNIMYIIIWFWRLTNGHSLMQMLITSVLFRKLWQFLDFIKYIGFLEIILLATVTELHIIDVKNFLMTE